MAGGVVFVSNLVKLPLRALDGDVIGRVADIVIAPPTTTRPPQLLGLVAAVNRRQVFVAASRIRTLDGSGVTLRTAAIDLRPFQLRRSETLARSLFDRRHGDYVVLDLGIAASDQRAGCWEVEVVALGQQAALRRRKPTRTVEWDDVPELWDLGERAREIAELRDLHPSDAARAVRLLSAEQRVEVAEAMEDEELADLLEELPESEQARILSELETDRAAHVLEEMQPDDAADLLSEFSREQRAELLEAMHPEEADPLRRLLLYDQNTAGGLMTSEPLVLGPDASVAEALARVRDPHIPPALAACVFVVEPPTQTPTGRYLGTLTFQHLLREPPSELLGHLVDGHPEPIDPAIGEVDVAERLAAYNLLALPVCDELGRLVGAVTVDDVLDRTLPAGWRSH